MNKQLLTKVLMVVAGLLAVYFLWDLISGQLIALLTLGAAGAAAVAEKKKKAEQAIAAADEHENMTDSHLVDSVRELNDAISSNQAAVDIANNSESPDHDKTPVGYRRKSIRSK